MPSTHAEVSAINKIIGWKNRPPKINLLVIKLSSDCSFSNSKPCFHCVKYLKKKSKQLNISKVYYSTNNGIVCENLNDMTSDFVSSGFRRLVSK